MLAHLPAHKGFTYLGVALFGATCAFQSWNLRAQHEVLDWGDHSRLVVQKSQELLTLLLEAEASAREFLITGVQDYLQPFRQARAKQSGQLESLRQLTADNNTQQNLLKQLNQLIDLKMSLLTEAVKLHDQVGSENAQSFVRNASGKQSMAAVLPLLARFEAQENGVLSARIQRRNRNSEYLTVAAWSSLFFGLLSLLVASIRHRRLQAAWADADRSKEELRILRQLIERAPMGVFMLDRRLRHVQVSQRWLDDMGLTRAAVVGKSLREIFPDLPQSANELYRRALEGETLSSGNLKLLTPGGNVRCVNWRMSPWGDVGETTGGIVIYADDVTDQMKAEDDAVQHELRYQSLFENMPDAVAYCEVILEHNEPKDFIFLAVNPALNRLKGTQNMVGRQVSDLYPAGNPPLLEVYSRVALTGTPEEVEYCDERIRQWLHISIFGQKEGFFFLVVEDITERKEKEFTARVWQCAFEASQSGIALADVQSGKITAANRAYSLSLGYTIEELTGRDIALLYPKEELAHRDAVLRAAESQGDHVLFETFHVKKGGAYFPVLVDITVVRNKTGQPVSHVKIVHDLTEMRRTSAALRTSEERAQSLFENASQGILTADAADRIVDANSMVHLLFGYTGPELIGAPVEMLLPEGFGTRAAGLAAARALPPPSLLAVQAMESVAVRKGGTEFPVEVSLSYLGNTDDALSIAFISDITERKRVDAELRESETHFRTLANAIPHLCWMADADGWIFWYNQRWYDYTGTTIEQMEGWGWTSVHDQDLLPEILDRWTASIATGDFFEMVFPLKGADGTFHPFLTRGLPVKNPEGKVTRWFGTNTDVSEQLETEETLRSQTKQLVDANQDLRRTSDALRISEARARSLFENAGQAILTTGPEGSIVDANAMAQRLFGFDPSDLIGASVEELLPQFLLSRHAANPAGKSIEAVGVCKDGTEFPVEISLGFVGEDHKGMSMAFVSDITARKKADREREDLIARLEDVVAEKTVLLQEVHHRVKNNLAVIAALLGMQSATIEDGRARVALETSQQRVLSMSRIHEFLYATKNLDRVAFGSYVEQLTSELCASYSVASSVSVTIDAQDIDLPMDQAIPCGLILNELLSNALKYAFPDGRTGNIVVRFVRLDSSELSLSCSDDGVGIPETFQLQNATSLGLRIVHILTKQVDGNLVLNRSDVGTSFALTFPQAFPGSAGRGDAVVTHEA